MAPYQRFNNIHRFLSSAEVIAGFSGKERGGRRHYHPYLPLCRYQCFPAILRKSCQRKRPDNPSSSYRPFLFQAVRLFAADSEHLGAADGANALGRRLAIFHGNRLGVLDFPLGAAFHAVSLHFHLLPFVFSTV
jgi:hypothetical protein